MEQVEAVPHHPDADSFDLRKSWENIKHAVAGHRVLVVLTMLLTVGMVVIYVTVWPAVYEAEVTIVADAKGDSQRDNFYQYWDVFRKDHLPDEAKLIASGPVLKKVVKKLNLTYDDVYHPFLSYAANLWTSSSIGKAYHDLKEWVFPKKPSPFAPTPEEVELGRTLHDFKEGVVLDSYPDTNVGRLVVRGPSPRVAEIANTLVDIYLQDRRDRHVQEAQEAYDSLSQEAAHAERQLVALEKRMQDYYTKNKLLLMFEKDKVEISQWLTLRASILDLRSQIADIRNSLAEVTVQLAHEPKEITSAYLFQKNSLRESLMDSRIKLELSLKQGLERYQPDAPEIREIREQMHNVDALIAAQPEDRQMQTTRVLSDTYETLRQRKGKLEEQLKGLTASLKVKEAAAKRMAKSVDALPEKMRMTHDMQREHDILEKKYTVLQDKLMMAAVSKTSALSAPPSMRVVEEATAPDKAIWPKTKLLLFLAIVVGLMAGVVLALLVDLVHGRVSRFRLAVAQGQLPVYAIVDQDRSYVDQLFPRPDAVG